MSNGLTLPFEPPPLNTDGNAFAITVTGGGTAIWAGGFGTDPYGDTGTGVYGETDVGVGVNGSATGSGGIGIQATSQSGTAIYANSNGDIDAVLSETSSNNHAALAGHNYGNGAGVWAMSQGGTAIVATNEIPAAGKAPADADAFVAFTSSSNHAAVAAHNGSAHNPGPVPNGFGVWASSNNIAIYGQGNPAGYFKGDVQVTGDLLLVNSSSGDIAEDFDLDDDPVNAEPGTVLIIHPSGKLSACAEPYDTRVAGVVSGAGNLRPAIVLQHLEHRPDRSPLALVGKALCKVDAAFGAIVAGDLLTTSPTTGHAMKVADRTKAIGAILGKALHPLDRGRGLVLILVSLR